MTCLEALEYMSRALDNDLSEKERIELEKHMEECDTCRREFDDMQAVFKDIKNEKQLELPSAFHEEMMKKLEETKVVPFAVKKRSYFKKYAAVAASMLVLAVVGVSGGFDVFSHRSSDLAELKASPSAAAEAAEEEAAFDNSAVAAQMDTGETSVVYEAAENAEITTEENDFAQSEAKTESKSAPKASSAVESTPQVNAVTEGTPEAEVTEADTASAQTEEEASEKAVDNSEDGVEFMVRSAAGGSVQNYSEYAEQNVNHMAVYTENPEILIEEVRTLSESLGADMAEQENGKYLVSGTGEACGKVRELILEKAEIISDDAQENMVYDAVEIEINP